VAAVRGALWASSDRQAALLLTMTVQQGLSTPERIAVEVLRIKKAPRLAHLRAVLVDLIGGVRSLAELDFAAQCRERGLPEPDRQVVRKGRDGRYYLDVYWDEWCVVVEIDGIHHAWATQVVSDALRHNAVTLQHDVVLRLPVLGLRTAPDDFFDQICEALVARGWSSTPPAA
jgi:very-short-patch-repair endonuclease